MSQFDLNYESNPSLVQINGILTELRQQIVSALQSQYATVATAVASMHAVIYDAYIADGAIYGETDEGMLRWISEINEIARLRAEAEYIVNRQAMCRDLKRQLHR